MPGQLPTVDLSRLPAPAFVGELSFAALRAAWLADFQARWPGFDALVESDPAIKLLEAGAYRELLTRAAINDAGRAVMLPFATGSDLDALAALYGVQRLVIASATDDAPAVLEPDADLRARVQLAPERFAAGGLTVGGYRARALGADSSIADVALIKRGGGQVDVVLLGRAGAVSAEAIATVAAALHADDVASLTDVIAVRGATILDYDVGITLQVRTGPDAALIRAAAEAGVRAYAASRARIGLPVYQQMLAAAASIGGVERAIVDIGDLDPGPAGAALLGDLTITVQVLG